MLYYLLDAYKLNIYDMQKRKIKELTKKEISALISIIIIGILSLIIMLKFYNVMIVYIITWIALIITGIIVFNIIVKKSRKNYMNNIQGYDKKLESLRKVLKEQLDLYSLDKIEMLIATCDEELSKKDFSSKMLQPIIRVFTGTILPIVTFVLGLAADGADFRFVVEYSILIICIIIYLTGLFYMIYPLMEEALNKDKYVIKSLRVELQDIIMMDFKK